MGKSVRIFMCISGFSNRSILDRIINFEKNIIPKNRKFWNGYFGKKKIRCIYGARYSSTTTMQKW